MWDIVKASRRPRRFARATGGGFPRLSGPGAGVVARGSRCPAPPCHALLAENPSLEAWGKPSLWVNIKDLWYYSASKRTTRTSRAPARVSASIRLTSDCVVALPDGKTMIGVDGCTATRRETMAVKAAASTACPAT